MWTPRVVLARLELGVKISFFVLFFRECESVFLASAGLCLPLASFLPKYPFSAVRELRHSPGEGAKKSNLSGRKHSANPGLRFGVVSLKTRSEARLCAK